MAEVRIIIRDHIDGHVETIVTPSMDEILKEIAARDGKGVAPSKLYATRAITAIMKMGKEAREGSKIITKLPGRY
jgi:hypothetical protein